CNADIARLQALIRESRLLHGADGPWLFGEFSAADAMLAPVAWRFTTYDVPHDDIVGAWLSTVLECEAMRAWANDARTETEIIAADEAGIPV
ncbi:MAG TPA: glutathione S-transferase C-terminal domain-containing protein, partial [Plasticicumulans sp.]|nr:glutathione S-transferase C-terminal domain-containing protein [Plasticicumulans sp.]